MKENNDKYTFMDTIKLAYTERCMLTEKWMGDQLDIVKEERTEHIDNLNTEILSFIADMRTDLIKEITAAYKKEIKKEKKIIEKKISDTYIEIKDDMRRHLEVPDHVFPDAIS